MSFEDFRDKSLAGIEVSLMNRASGLQEGTHKSNPSYKYIQVLPVSLDHIWF